DENKQAVTTYIVEAKTDSKGGLFMQGDWGSFANYPNARVELKVIDGKKSFVKFIADADGNPILDEDPQPIVFNVRRRKPHAPWPWPNVILDMHWVNTLRAWHAVELPGLQNMSFRQKEAWFENTFQKLAQICTTHVIHPKFVSFFNRLLQVNEMVLT